MNEHRIAKRIVVNAPVMFESIGQPPVSLHPALENVYTRVEASREHLGRRFSGTLRDISTNGAFVVGVPLPLLSRITMNFTIDGVGTLDAVGWIMWRRDADCTIDTANGETTLSAGFGVLFEALPLEARRAIATMVRNS